MGDYTFFFYGTLMSPAILHRVIHGSSTPEPCQKSQIISRPALLPGYRRHRVHHADYPALIPIDDNNNTNTNNKNNNSSSSTSKPAESAAVLGTVVTGITEGDVRRLDNFEGPEYSKRSVRVKMIRGINGIKCTVEGDGSLQHALEDTASAGSDEIAFREMEELEALTYVWTAGKERLDLEHEWDYEHFKKEKLQWWVEADESEW